MKKLLALCLLTCLIWATPRDADYIDNGAFVNLPHRVLPSRQAAVLVDSSGNCYSGWTNIQQCLSYYPTMGYLEFLNRGYSPTGQLYVHQTDNNFSFWVDDFAYDNALHGNARYPSSLASSNGPHLGFPVLDPITLTWGHMCGEYEVGGWFNSLWDPAVDLSGDIGSPRSVPQELPNGDIIFFADMTATIHYETWSADLTTQRSSGDLGTSGNMWGCDVNGGTCYLFSYTSEPFPDIATVTYWTTTDGVAWSSPAVWDIPFPDPYGSNTFLNNNFGRQMAVTDAGNPILVFALEDGADATYPFDSRVYVSTASGATPIQVSEAGRDVCWYQTIATGGNDVVVLYHAWTNALEDSLARHDLFARRSNDNGATWGVLENLTGAVAGRPGLGQLAKRVDATNGNFFYFYGVMQVYDQDPIYVAWLHPIDTVYLSPTGWYVGWHPMPGVAEHETETPKFASLNFAPNPVSNRAAVSYALSEAGNISLRIFDLAGRDVETVECGYRDAGVYNVNVDTRKFANGTYFFVLDTPKGSISRSLIVVH